MAKLEGVKVIDAVNGEVTKIKYEGAEYAKADDVMSAKDGDILLRINRGLIAVHVGEYYRSKGVSRQYNEVCYVDRDSEEISGSPKAFVLFRKVSAPSLEDRVTALEGDVKAMKSGKGDAQGYRKVGRSIRVGDYVKAIRTDDSHIEVGKFYEVTGISTLGNPQFVDSVGDQNVLTSEEEYEVYEKVTEKPVKTIRVHYKRTKPEYLPKPAQVGDKIVITDVNDERYENGDEFTVDRLAFNGGVYVVSPGGYDIYVTAREFEIIERPEAKPALKVGDYAKVTGGIGENGIIVKIVREDGSRTPYMTEDLDGNFYSWKSERTLTPATDEEVAAAKRQAEEQAKQAAHAKIFTDAGREIDEYKAGDIVEFTESFFSHRDTTGEIYEIESANSPAGFTVNGGKYAFPSWCKPVVFVENRLDRN